MTRNWRTSKARRSLCKCKWPASTSASSRNCSGDATAHSAGHDLGPRAAADRPCYVTPWSLPNVGPSHIARLVSLSCDRSGNCMRAKPDVCFKTWFRVSRRRTEGDPGRELMCWACPARGHNMNRRERYRKLLNLSTALGACGCNGLTVRKFSYAYKSWSFSSINLFVLFFTFIFRY